MVYEFHPLIDTAFLEKDLLDRKHYVESFTANLCSEGSPKIAALDGEWGSGKTFFVGMWMQFLKQQNFDYLYFNAWENDYLDDPFSAFSRNFQIQMKQISKNKGFTKTRLDELWKKFGNAAFEITKQGILIKAGLDIEKIRNIFFDENNEVEDLRSLMKQAIDKICVKKPIFIFIDELDRCRPVFAMRILERIKHVFSVDNSIFVLVISKKPLIRIINAQYGFDPMNVSEFNRPSHAEPNLEFTSNYLRRFIDVELKLPKIMPGEYILAQHKKHGVLNDVFKRITGNTQKDFPALSLPIENGDLIVSFFQLLANNFHLNDFRTQEQITNNYRMILAPFEKLHYIPASVILFLAFIRTLQSDLFIGFQRNKQTADDFFRSFLSLFQDERRKYFGHEFAIFVLLFLPRINKLIEDLGEKNRNGKLEAYHKDFYEKLLEALKVFPAGSEIYSLPLEEMVSLANLSFQVTKDEGTTP